MLKKSGAEGVMIRLTLFITALTMLLLNMIAVTEADIQACVENTNYSKETCKFELML